MSDTRDKIDGLTSDLKAILDSADCGNASLEHQRRLDDVLKAIRFFSVRLLMCGHSE